MATWACGHAFRARLTNRNPDWLQELGARERYCPACEAQERRNRQHWAALVTAVVLALLLVCAVAGGGR